jgi:hypothetical protein
MNVLRGRQTVFDYYKKCHKKGSYHTQHVIVIYIVSLVALPTQKAAILVLLVLENHETQLG